MIYFLLQGKLQNKYLDCLKNEAITIGTPFLQTLTLSGKCLNFNPYNADKKLCNKLTIS